MLGNLKLFSIISLLVIITVAGSAGMAFRNMATQDLLLVTERNNKALAEGYLNNVWKPYRDVVQPIASSNPALLRNNPQVIQFAAETVRFFKHMPLVRVNVYSDSGVLILSINPDPQRKLVDKPASPNSESVKAHIKSSTVSSNIVATMLAGNEISLAQTLIPLQLPESAQIDGTIEMLYDITEPLGKQMDFQMMGTLGVIAMFLLFLGVLFFSSRRAENIIAKQHEANMDLAAAAAAAEKENREKSQFLANISHELRTPLNAIIGFSNIIKDEVMPLVENQKYKDYIGDINSSGVHLLSLINDILDYSKAEAGKLEMEVSEVNATKLVQNSMRLVEPRAEIAKVKLTEAMPKEAIIMITDSKKFKQILLNLLSNAVKFTPAGGEVRVTAWRDLADDTVSFEVRDSGIGIAPKDISRAMAPFGQVDSALSRKYEGTGLGLPLTKKFVELMGGKFNIESEVGKGTIVTFTLSRELKEREGVIIKQVA